LELVVVFYNKNNKKCLEALKYSTTAWKSTTTRRSTSRWKTRNTTWSRRTC